MAKEKEQQVTQERWRGQRCQMDGIRTPRLAIPYMFFMEHTGEVASPVAS